MNFAHIDQWFVILSSSEGDTLFLMHLTINIGSHEAHTINPTFFKKSASILEVSK